MPLLGIGLGLAAGMAGACGADDTRPSPRPADVAGNEIETTVPDPCRVPTSTGCPCDTDGEVIECGELKVRYGDYVTCVEGTRACESGEWSQCLADHTTTKHLAGGGFGALGLRRLGLANLAVDCEDPCNPDCTHFEDTPVGADLGEDLSATADGVTISTTEFTGGNCNNLSVGPADSTVTITQINTDGTMVATPSDVVSFTATCVASGTEVVPSWTIDAYDRAVIDADGQLTLFSGTPAPIHVTASSSADDETVTLEIVVDIEDRGTDTTVATAFDGAGSDVDAGKTLYPYRNTVFPLDLKAPLVQWDTGGKSATDVQVALRYQPAESTSPTFSYSKIYNGTEPKQGTLSKTVPAWQVPQEVWSAFDRSAAGGTGEIIIQRRYSGSVHQEMIIPVTFATEPLRGTVYYTQYERTLYKSVGDLCSASSQSDISPSSYKPGDICPVGNCTHPNTSSTSMTRAINMAYASAVNTDPFSGAAGCPVCHSISKDGTTHVAGSQRWQSMPSGTSKGVNSVGTTGSASTFTALRQAPNYTVPGTDYEDEREQSWGFSYAPLTPDGTRVLQGPAFWGNTDDTPTSKNLQSAVRKGVTSNAKPYFFVSTANPGLGVQFATTAALPGNSRSGNVLVASSNGTLTIDGATMIVPSSGPAYSVLVKDESTKANNGIYTVTAAGGSGMFGSKWSLTRRSDADGSGEILSGMDVRVSDGNTNRGKVFYVSTAGTITINTTQISLGQRTMPTLPSMMVPVFSPDGTKVAYVNADADTIGTASTGWRRGLSMLDIDPATLAISGKKRLLSTWNATTPGTPMKWPFFEHDSEGLIYVESHSNEFCDANAKAGKCTVASASDTYALATCAASGSVSVNTNLERACFEAGWGSMSPTGRGFWPGAIYSINTSAADPSTTRVELSNLNDAEDASDANSAHQPTVLPLAVGGYRWVVFTSPRSYGNQLNMKGTHFSCGTPMLWVSALDNRAADGTDRSHPAFFLPGQNAAPITTATHWVNERGYLVPSPCKGTGISCTTNDECCGSSDAPPTAACRVAPGWTVADGVPTKICAALSGTCSNEGETCNTSTDCCGNAPCEEFTCASVPTYEGASFTRDYVADCVDGFYPEWQLFSYHLTTPGDSSIRFQAQTGQESGELDSAPLVTLGTSTEDVVGPALPEGLDVATALFDANQPQANDYLRIIVTLVPTSDKYVAPTLHDWALRYECVAGD